MSTVQVYRGNVELWKSWRGGCAYFWDAKGGLWVVLALRARCIEVLGGDYLVKVEPEAGLVPAHVTVGDEFLVDSIVENVTAVC